MGKTMVNNIKTLYNVFNEKGPFQKKREPFEWNQLHSLCKVNVVYKIILRIQSIRSCQQTKEFDNIFVTNLVFVMCMMHTKKI